MFTDTNTHEKLGNVTDRVAYKTLSRYSLSIVSSSQAVQLKFLLWEQGADNQRQAMKNKTG